MTKHSPVMHFTGGDGKVITYGGADDKTPVPRRTYRCPATAKDATRLDHTHPCKLTVDHDEAAHQCVCGKQWEPVPA